MLKNSPEFQKCISIWEANPGIIFPNFLMYQIAKMRENSFYQVCRRDNRLELAGSVGYRWRSEVIPNTTDFSISTNDSGKITIKGGFDADRNMQVGAIRIGDMRITQFGQIIFESVSYPYAESMPMSLSNLLLVFYGSENVELNAPFRILPLRIFLHQYNALFSLYNSNGKKRTDNSTVHQVDNGLFSNLKISNIRNVRDMMGLIGLSDNKFQVDLKRAKDSACKENKYFPLNKISLVLRNSLLYLACNFLDKS